MSIINSLRDQFVTVSRTSRSKLWMALGLFAVVAHASPLSANQSIANFQSAKRLLRSVHKDLEPRRIYCDCKQPNCDDVWKAERRDPKVDWEHVVPASLFGVTFSEWTEGSEKCQSKTKSRTRGRSCAETNEEFSRMEGDLHNLWPTYGTINRKRSSHPMAEPILRVDLDRTCGYGIMVGRKRRDSGSARLFVPPARDRGLVARAYLYMADTYKERVKLTAEELAMFTAWDKQHPPDAFECLRHRRAAAVQGNPNRFIAAQCSVR